MNSLRKTFPLLKNVYKSKESLKITSKFCSTISKPEEEKSIIVEKVSDLGVTTIGINRPHRKNALDTATADYLAEAITNFEEDAEAVIGILYGCGGCFCSGIDLHELAEYDGSTPLPQFGKLKDLAGRQIKKPMVASIDGYAVGAGLELALMCDLRVMDEQAILGVFGRRFGVPLLFGGTIRLPVTIGYGRANSMILQGRPVNAKEALSWGLVDEVVSCGAALGQAVQLARSLVKFPRKTLMADRLCTHDSVYSNITLDEKKQFESDVSEYLLHEEGVAGAKQFQSGIGHHGKFKNLKEEKKDFKELDKDLL